jgi:gluconolactonase
LVLVAVAIVMTIRLPIVFLLLTFPWGSSTSVQGDDFDLYYLGGQSNMEGFGRVEELDAAQRQTVADAWIYQATPAADQQPATGAGCWSPLQPGHGTGFVFDGRQNRLSDRFGVELSFARTLLSRRPGRKLAIIKYARNGSSIDARAAAHWGCWEPDFEAKAGNHRDLNQYDHFLATVREASLVSDIDGDGTKDRLIPAGIVWMQGESDAMHSQEIAEQYRHHLKRLTDLMRAALRADDLPLVVGRISDSRRGQGDAVWKYGETVRQAQAEVVGDDRSARLVTETDEYRYADRAHYDSQGYLQLGQRFAEALLTIPSLPPGSMFEEGAELRVEVAGGTGGEGPVWDAEWGVLASGNGNIHRWSLERQSSIFRPGAGTNGLLIDPQGRLIACEPKQRRVSRMSRDGQWSVLTEQFEGKKYNQPNDLSMDSLGRIYFSDPRYGDRATMEIRDEQGRTVEGVYRIDLNGGVVRVIGREVERANGVLVTAGDRFLVVADNNNNSIGGARKLWRFEIDREGNVDLSTQRLLYDWGQGRGPDGLKQDVAGNLYVAAGLNRSHPPYEPDAGVRAGIYVLDIDGRLLDFMPVPTDEVTNCAFGGDDGKTLFITAGGTLYSLRTQFAGKPLRR